VLVAVENAIWPDLIIVGGGISRKADKWVPLLKNRTPVVAAALQNSAGIVGAAMAAVDATTEPDRPSRAESTSLARSGLFLSLQWSRRPQHG
jgi:hypothetical protein